MFRLRHFSGALAAIFLGAALFPAASRAATVTVTGTGDTVAVDGVVTLREAIASINGAANVNADVVAVGAYGTSDTINFAIPGAGVHTILPTSQFVVTKPVLINGYSQPGSSANSLAVGNNAVLLIEIDGTNAGLLRPEDPDGGGGAAGLLEINGGASAVRGLVINRAQGGNSAGLLVKGTGSTVAGDFVGMDPTGTIARPNGCQGVGVVSSGNTIGGLAPADRNLISATSGCGGNLVLDGPNNVVENNYIGTNAAGTASRGGSSGVVTSSAGNTIGGTTAAQRNVISGNGIGVNMFGGASGNLVEGNFIGTDASGTVALGNGDGVQFSGGAHDNTVGGTAAGAGNTIAFNSQSGVSFRPPPSAAGAGNRILGNLIYSNGTLGIDFNQDGVTPNDGCDTDTGSNNLQNFPVITSAIASGGSIAVQGTLNSTASTGPYRIEIFANDTCDPSGNGEGKTFLGSTTTSTDPACNGSFNVTLPVSVPRTSKLTATATAPNGSTSEFSPCAVIAAQFYTVTPCRVIDTRLAAGPLGGPALSGGASRTFVLVNTCGIPTTARGVSVNIAVTQAEGSGHLRIFPTGAQLPIFASINFSAGQTRSNDAVLPLSLSGGITVYAGIGAGLHVDLILDVNGYFE